MEAALIRLPTERELLEFNLINRSAQRLEGSARGESEPGSGMPASAKPFSRRMQLSQAWQG